MWWTLMFIQVKNWISLQANPYQLPVAGSHVYSIRVTSPLPKGNWSLVTLYALSTWFLLAWMNVLQVWEKSGYRTVEWVRYITKAGSYEIRCWSMFGERVLKMPAILLCLNTWHTLERERERERLRYLPFRGCGGSHRVAQVSASLYNWEVTLSHHLLFVYIVFGLVCWCRIGQVIAWKLCPITSSPTFSSP